MSTIHCNNYFWPWTFLVSRTNVFFQFSSFDSQTELSVHDKLHELHSYFPPIAKRTPSIITSSCWKSTVSDVTASVIDRKMGCVQIITCVLALSIRNEYDYKMKEYVDVLTSQSLLIIDFNIKIFIIKPLHGSTMCSIDFGVKRSKSQCIDNWK